MSNVTVQEALKSEDVYIFDINQPFVTQEQKFKYWEESKAEIKRLKAALVEIDKCEPVAWMDETNRTCNALSKKCSIGFADGLFDTYNIPLYTSPQPRDLVNKDLLETDDGKWDGTIKALWRRLQGRHPSAEFWDMQEIPDDEMYIFRAHFATALLASPIKQLNTKG